MVHLLLFILLSNPALAKRKPPTKFETNLVMQAVNKDDSVEFENLKRLRSGVYQVRVIDKIKRKCQFRFFKIKKEKTQAKAVKVIRYKKCRD